MSFAELGKSAVALREKVITIDGEADAQYIFKAKELSYLERVAIGSVTKGDLPLQLLLFAITDADGHHMTVEQAIALPNDVQEVFYKAALEVNTLPEGESEKKT